MCSVYVAKLVFLSRTLPVVIASSTFWFQVVLSLIILEAMKEWDIFVSSRNNVVYRSNLVTDVCKILQSTHA